MIPKFFTKEEIAKIARAPISTVEYWIFQKLLPSRKVGRRRLVTEGDLRRFLGLEDEGKE